MSLAEPFCCFSAGDLDRIARSTFVAGIEHHRELPSTNTQALQLATEKLAMPWLVLADRQTAGRGRGANRWWSDSGALTLSLVLDPVDTPSAVGPTIALTAGLAACEALQQLSPGLDAALKWPNDVYVQSRKIGGILVETSPQPKRRVVVGMGVNVNNSLTEAPEPLRETATSLIDVSRYPFALADVVIAVLGQFATLLDGLRREPQALQRLWETHCMLTGRRVSVIAGGQLTEGECCGIGTDGAILIATAKGVVPCRTGEVLEWH